MSEPPRPLPESLTRYLPERAGEPTPEETFRAWLAEQLAAEAAPKRAGSAAAVASS